MNTSTATITEDEHFAIFFLSHVDTIGCETIKRIDSRLDHIVDIFNMQDKDLKPVLSMSEAQIYEFINVKKQLPSIIREYELLLRSDIRFCTFKDNTYPCRLKKIRHNPAVLYSYGSLPSDNVPSVGIVGSRACTAYGASVAEHLAEVLADNGVNIISGMAVGIDTAAHKGSLRSAHNHTDQIDNGTYQGS